MKHCAVDSKQIDAAVLTSLEERAAAMNYVDLNKILPTNMPEKYIEKLTMPFSCK